ncbi:MAG: C45 family autoproteolytic acyltransferase/hydrolase [Alphaproteobacteria bacterium]
MTTGAGVKGLDRVPVVLPAGAGRAESSLRRVSVKGKTLNILRQRGTLPGMAYDQGRLLAKEIQSGVFPEILSSIARGTDLGDPLKNTGAAALFRALRNCVATNISEEFQSAITSLAQGYRDALHRPRFTADQVTDAVVGIEVENLADGISRRFQMPSMMAKAKTAAEVVEMFLANASQDDIRQLLTSVAQGMNIQSMLGDAFTRLSHPRHRSGFACTGFSVPGRLAADGRHLHARNLDADLYSWNDSPALYLMDETPGGAGRHKYVAFGTAGLLYPGGISGINDAGIAASLHQLSTTRYRLKFDKGHADIAPFVQQRVLREASSLKDAVEIIKSRQAFGAWVIFCSDAKSGQSRRVEFNGDTIRVGPVTSSPMAQTNHFIHPDLVEHLFDENDAHFTPSFGKWLETRSRMAMVDGALARGTRHARIDMNWAIDLLASGRDGALLAVAEAHGLDSATSGVERSFGRVPRKAYGQLSTIVRGDPQRRSGGDEAWMTIGDQLPGCESHHVGWQVDWTGFDVKPVASDPIRRTTQYVRSGRSNWERSFELYLSARVATVRPRDAKGRLLSRARNDAERRASDREAERLLTAAIALAAKDRVVEVPYHFMRARIRHDLGRYRSARQDWDLLRDIWAHQTRRPRIPAHWPVREPRVQPIMHEYEAALTLTLSVVTEDRARRNAAWSGRDKQLRAALNLLLRVKTESFGKGKPAHFDLVAWIDRVRALQGKGRAEVTLPDPNFVTAE